MEEEGSGSSEAVEVKGVDADESTEVAEEEATDAVNV